MHLKYCTGLVYTVLYVVIQYCMHSVPYIRSCRSYDFTIFHFANSTLITRCKSTAIVVVNSLVFIRFYPTSYFYCTLIAMIKKFRFGWIIGLTLGFFYFSVSKVMEKGPWSWHQFIIFVGIKYLSYNAIWIWCRQLVSTVGTWFWTHAVHLTAIKNLPWFSCGPSICAVSSLLNKLTHVYFNFHWSWESR